MHGLAIRTALTRLLRTPHTLNWQSITCSLPAMTLYNTTANALTALPSLTELHVWLETIDADFLQHLPQLTRLQLQMGAEGPKADALMHGLLSCTGLTELGVTRGEFTADHWSQLLPGMAALRSLSLSAQPRLHSLDFLSTASLQQSLTELSIHASPILPLAEMQHLYGLRALQSLSLTRSFLSPLDAHTRLQLTPPSALLPALRLFDYTAPFETQDPEESE
jgi:hypothetical protein